MAPGATGKEGTHAIAEDTGSGKVMSVDISNLRIARWNAGLPDKRIKPTFPSRLFVRVFLPL